MDKVIAPGVILHREKFLMFLGAEITLGCQGYLVNQGGAKSLNAYAEPAYNIPNLYTVTMKTSTKAYIRDAQNIDTVYNVLQVWAEPGHQPFDAGYKLMPYRE